MNEAPPYVIGIDGGGTGCRVAISDAEGALVGTAIGGAANYASAPEATVQNLLDALSGAARSAGLSMDELRPLPTHIGAAGVVTSNDAAKLADALPLAQCAVSNDQLTTVIGALGSRDGAVVSVGTGSFVAFKRNAEIEYVGGWGLNLGDQGYGAWLGQKALKRCALVNDGLAETSEFIQTLIRRFSNNAGVMIAFAKAATPSDYAQLAPTVFDAAEQNDPYATALVIEGADYLDQCLGKAQLIETDVICLAGGLGPFYEDWLDHRYQARLANPQGSALDGAVQLARQLNIGGDAP